jgi:CRISPR/Cas system-associated exonuclease Cas4 (RecB family)
MDKSLGFRKFSEPFDSDKLSAAIEAGYLSQARANKFTKKVSFAPSSIGYNHARCARYWFMAFEGAMFEESVDAMGIANMSNGTYAHERIQKVLEDAGILVAKEVEITLKDPPIRGYVDAMVRLDGEILVGEIKTTRQEAFMFKQNSMKPSINHLYQILIYLRATGKQNGFLLYENKSDNTFLIIPVTMDERNSKILDDALDWLREVYLNSQEGALPTRPFTKKSKECKGCPLFKVCWDEKPDGEVEIKPMAVVKI